MSCLRTTDQPGEALTASEQSLTILTKLAEANPTDTQIQADLAEAITPSAGSYGMTGPPTRWQPSSDHWRS